MLSECLRVVMFSMLPLILYCNCCCKSYVNKKITIIYLLPLKLSVASPVGPVFIDKVLPVFLTHCNIYPLALCQWQVNQGSSSKSQSSGPAGNSGHTMFIVL